MGTEILIEWRVSAEGYLSRYTIPAVSIKQCLCRPVRPRIDGEGTVLESRGTALLVATPAALPHDSGMDQGAPTAERPERRDQSY
jgi:hypothetical protein